jgi:hypothetical protein
MCSRGRGEAEKAYHVQADPSADVAQQSSKRLDEMVAQLKS